MPLSDRQSRKRRGAVDVVTEIESEKVEVEVVADRGRDPGAEAMRRVRAEVEVRMREWSRTPIRNPEDLGSIDIERKLSSTH